MAMALNLVLIGLEITLDSLPLTAFIAVLPSKRGVTKGAAFVFGWLLSLAVVVTVTVLATGNNPPEPSTAPSLAALAAKVAIGVVLVTIAIRHIRVWGRPKPPKWQEHVDSMSPWFALGLGPALQPWVFKPGQSQALLATFRTWIDTHTDQVIISGSLILGFWLLAHRQQPVPDPHLRHPQISMELS